MSDEIIVLTKRPSRIKKVYKINYKNRKTPMENRNTEEFNYYYNEIWKELDINV